MEKMSKRFSEWELDENLEDDEALDQDIDELLDDDSDDKGDDDGHADDESEEEEGKEDDDDTSDDEKTIKLKDGTEVSLDELKSGYMRQQDYTRKTQELSQQQKQEVVEKSKEIVENKSEYPEEDVKAAKYFLKIALTDPNLKKEFGLVTKAEIEAQKAQDETRAKVESQLSDVKSMAKDLGIKSPSDDDILKYMQENGIYNAKLAFKEMKEDEIFEAKMKAATKKKNDVKYKSEKGSGKRKQNNKEKEKQSMDDFLDTEIDKMDTEEKGF